MSTTNELRAQVLDLCARYEDELQYGARVVSLSPLADVASELRDAVRALDFALSNGADTPDAWLPDTYRG